MKREAIVAIDGTAGSGKSTTAQLSAEEVGYMFLDTGAMYRAITLMALRRGVADDDEASLAQLAVGATIEFQSGNGSMRILLDGEDVSEQIRSPRVDGSVSAVSSFPRVREKLVAEQRRIAGDGGVVCEGRDIGTVVFPDADLKFYMDASLDVRAARRLNQLIEKGVTVSLDEVKRYLDQRDRLDSQRDASPLAKAPDAMVIDTTELAIAEQVAVVVDRIEQWRAAAQRDEIVEHESPGARP